MPKKQKVKLGDAISVYWRDDREWYNGEVTLVNEISGDCVVLYEDGERETLNLAKERYKIIKGGKVRDELLDRVFASRGDLSKQLQHIAVALRDTADRLPAVGCCSNRPGWWSAWYSDIESAVEAGHLIKLVKVTYDLACQLRPSITTAWWEKESDEWRQQLRSVTTCEGLVNSVQELRKKGVDWAVARELFPAPSD